MGNLNDVVSSIEKCLRLSSDSIVTRSEEIVKHYVSVEKDLLYYQKNLCKYVFT